MTAAHAEPAPQTAAPANVPVLRRCGGTTCPPGTCDHDGELQRYAAGPGPDSAPSSVHQVLGTSGEPLDGAVRTDLESRFGHDFSQVRVHADGEAATSARAVGAQAYTVGNHIAFAAGSYAPDTSAGRRLIAHELTHVVQQAGTPSAPAPSLTVGAVDDPAELEADAVAEAVLSDEPVQTLLPSSQVLRRACPPVPSGIAAAPLVPFPCTARGDEAVGGDIVQICQDSTDPVDGQTAVIDDVVARARTANQVEIHGNASTDGPSADYNRTLACMRARAFRDLLVGRGVTTPIRLFSHDPTTVYGPAASNRNVVFVMPQKGASAHRSRHLGLRPTDQGPPIGAVEVRTGEEAIVGASSIMANTIALEYTGLRSATTHWLQFVWFEMTAVTPAGSARLSGTIPTTSGNHPFSTAAAPAWRVDTASATSPFYESGGVHVRDSGVLTAFDAPGGGSAGPLAQAVFNAGVGATSVTFAAHFSSFLVQDGGVMYHVPWVASTVFTLDAANNLVTAPIAYTLGTPANASALPANLRTVLDTAFPGNTVR